MDIPGPSEHQGVPPRAPPVEQFTPDDIREEVQRRVRLAREQEIQRQVNLILERDRLVREEQTRLDEEARQAEQEHGEREPYLVEDPPYTPTYSPLYINFILPKYGSTRTTSYRPSVVRQTVPPVDQNATILQEIIVNQKREFDEFKQTVLTSLTGRMNHPVTHAVMPFTTRLNAVSIPVGFILPQFKQYNGTGDPQKHLKGFFGPHDNYNE
ncbi:hypothetical protein LIER_41318 [Lithospermum erythrorhizon]|uniref:Uncharacterized protein n=1 Tax=Lithospermum erythrorhizon TaxID=34254 RepID=A0AAV3R9I4_LITER